MVSFTINYSLGRAGWAFATVSNNAEYVEMTASYLHDSLRDLALCGIALLKGADRASTVFMDEPGEHHLLFKREGENNVHYEVRWYDDWASWDIYPIDKYKVVITGSSTLNQASDEILKVLREVFDKHGNEEYKKLWIEHDFPEQELRELNQLKNYKTNI